MDKVYDVIINHLAEITGYDLLDISLTDSLVNDLGLDSMMAMDFYRLLVNDFPEIKEADLENIFQQEDVTVGTILSLVSTELGLDNKPLSLLDSLPEVIEFHQYLNAREHVPYFRKNDGIASNRIIIEGEEKINYSTYNYLGINGSDFINQSVIEAISRFGTSVSGSRLLSGEIKIHQELEQKISHFLGSEDAIIQVGGTVQM